ncbi:MAG: 3-deoxy-D-manno-octulosonic acid transferase, partial [Aeoliella sp.]
VWIHAVSVGEVNLLATTLGELAQRRPDLEIVISTTTKTGYDLALRNYGNQHSVFYCPLDFSWAVRRAMQRVRPVLLVLAELELWPNLIAAAKESGARVAIINGRLSDNSFRGYRHVSWLVRRVLNQVDLIAAQDESTAERFNRLRLRAAKPQAAKPQAIHVTGSLKYDGAETNRNNEHTGEFRALAGFKDHDVIWLAGSTQAPEEAMAIRIFQELSHKHPTLRLMIVPRHPERFDEVAKLLDESGIPWQRRSKLQTQNPQMPDPESRILLIDSIGELGAWWGTASIGLVGGSFGDRGGQNMIEPAAYGVATCFGPNTKNFSDIVAALVSAGAAQVVHSEEQLAEFVTHCLDDPAAATALGDRARALVAMHLGATARTVDLLETLIPVKDRQVAAA